MNDIYKVPGTRQAASADAAAVSNPVAGTSRCSGKQGANTGALTSLPFLRSVQRTAIFLLAMMTAVCGLTITSVAQLVPCAGTVPQVTAASLSARLLDDVVVNCDMLQHDRAGHTIKVIAYGKRWAPLYSSGMPFPFGGTATPEAHIYAEDWAGHNLIINLPQDACRPDVVLADDPEPQPGGPIRYRVGVVYQVGPIAYMDVWELTNCGLTSFMAMPVVGSVNIPLNDQSIYPGMLCDSFHNGPHIDMWSDAGNTNPNTGLPLMHDFAVVWTQGPLTATISGPQVIATHLFIRTGNINSNPVTWLPDSLGEDAYMPDVACLADNTSGTAVQKAEIVYYNPSVIPQDLMRVEYNRTVPPAPGITTGSTLPLDNGEFFSPRIEAMSQYDSLASPSTVKWQIVTSTGKLSFTPVWQTWGYNDVTGSTWLSSMFTAATDSDSKAPCVAAGINPAFSSDLGNRQYTAGFYPRAYTNIYERSIDAYAGTPDARWWQVNCATVDYHWDAARSMAVSNCSNSGLDLLTAWFDGSFIVYKESPNAMVFKTTGTSSIKGNGFSVYPNPVPVELHIDGAMGATYSISDATGRLLVKGKVAAEGTVDVRHLHQGLYLLSISKDKGSSQTIKFTKD